MLIRVNTSLCIVTLILSLSACGGGGGEPPVVEPPVIITPPVLGPGQVASAEGTYQGETPGKR